MAASSVSITEDKFLGKGAYGSVYLHYDEKTKAFVAVKRIDIGPVSSEAANITKALKAVRKEISMMKDLHHKRIVPYIREGRESNIFSIYMEYVSGGSVENILIKDGALSEDTTKKYTLQLLEGLSYLHQKRIIHRDVKGSNILCDGKGNIKLADFGISKQMNRLYTLTSKASKNTAMKGTGYWMAPEVIKADNYGTRADIWSTGATVVEMLTKHPPWYELEQFQAMFKIATLVEGGYNLDSKISTDAEDFLTQTFMLEEQRPRAKELLKHSWLKAAYEENMREENKTKLKEFYKQWIDGPLEVGQVWYIVAYKWLESWKDFVNFSNMASNQMSNAPGPIDNSELLTKEGELKDQTVENRDFATLPEKVWNMFVSCYGMSRGQKPLSRNVIEMGTFSKRIKIELYPLELLLSHYKHPTGGIPHKCSLNMTIGQLKMKMMELFEIPKASEVKLVGSCMSSDYDNLDNNNETLGQAYLQPRQFVVILEKEGAVWPQPDMYKQTSASCFSAPPAKTVGSSTTYSQSSTSRPTPKGVRKSHSLWFSE